MNINNEFSSKNVFQNIFCRSTVTLSNERSWCRKLFDWTRVITPEDNKNLFTEKSWSHLRSAERWKIFKNWINIAFAVAGVTVSVFAAKVCPPFVAKQLPFMSMSHQDKFMCLGIAMITVVGVIPLFVVVAFECGVVALSVLLPGAAVYGAGYLVGCAIEHYKVGKHHGEVLKEMEGQLKEAFKKLDLKDPNVRYRAIQNLHNLRQVLLQYRIDQGVVAKSLKPFNNSAFSKEQMEHYQLYLDNSRTFLSITKTKQNELLNLFSQYKQAYKLSLSEDTRKEIASKLKETNMLLTQAKKNQEKRYDKNFEKQFEQHFFHALAQDDKSAVEYFKKNSWDRIGFLERTRIKDGLKEEVNREKSQFKMWLKLK